MQGKSKGTSYKAVVIRQSWLKSYGVETIIVPVLQMSKPRLREVNIPSLMARKGKGSGMNWGPACHPGAPSHH